MSDEGISKSNIRKITKVAGGSSYAITLPIDYVRDLGWDDNQQLVVRRKGEKLIVKEWKKDTLPFPDE